MTDFRKTLNLLGETRTSTLDSLYRSRDKKNRISHDVDDLCHDIYNFERKLNKKYRDHVRESEEAKRRMKDIGDFKIYPKGVRHGNFPLYTEDGHRFELEKPAGGNVCDKYLFSNSGSNNFLKLYSVV